MKKIYTTIIMLALAVTVNATIITVDNKANSGADYTSLQDAIDNATAGDTIYVAGSGVSYGNIVIDKQLVLFGQGYNPNNQSGLASTVNDIRFDLVPVPASDPSGSHVEGFQADEFIIDDADGAISNITLRRNRFSVSTSDLGNGANNIVIENNVITTIDMSSSPSNVQATNIILRNNILTSDINSAASASILISNNIFITTSNIDVLDNCDFVIFSNNIVYGPGVGSTSNDCESCTFTNNISFGSNATDFDYAANTGGSNLEATDPLFESAAFGTNYLFESDYRLATGSPGIGAGSDATDIGIYGGVSPFPIEDAAGHFTSPFPSIPQVFELNILNSSIPENGTLNVQFKAKKID